MLVEQTRTKVGGTVGQSLLEQMETAAKYRVEGGSLACRLCIITTVVRRMEGNGIYVCPCLRYSRSQNNVVKLQQLLLLAKVPGNCIY